MADNIKFLNAIRGQATEDYNERIPMATQGNLAEIVDTILTYPNIKNEFLTVLTNKVGKTIFMQKLYNNPYKFFRKGTLEYGQSIESIFIDLIQAKSFGEHFGDGTSEASSLLSKETANVKVEYYSENYRNKYKLSISDQRLKSAFTSPNGLQQLLNSILIAPINSAEYDEFLMIKQALGISPTTEITIADYTTLGNDFERSKMLNREIKTIVSKFGFLSKEYNTREVMTFAKPNEIVILVTPETKAMIDVELLSSAFNMPKADVEGRLILIDEFQKLGLANKAVVDEDTLALVCDESFIQFYETLDHSENFRNPDLLTTNNFYHKWGVIASCGYVNAVKIKKGAVAIIEEPITEEKTVIEELEKVVEKTK